VNETLSETVLTHAIRTPLMPNGLRTTLLTVQNAFVVLGARQGFLGKSTLSLGYPLEAKSAAYPFAPLIPATTRQGCLGSGVARPRSGFVPFGADQPWPEIRPADVCNPTFQRRTPGASRGYRFFPLSKVSPGGVGERCGSRRNRPLRPATHPSGERFLPNPSSSAVPLTLLSPPKQSLHLCQLFSNDRDRLTAFRA
jgi:hypothetical protein